MEGAADLGSVFLFVKGMLIIFGGIDMSRNIINWLGGAQDALRELDAKAQAEVIKYSNRQVRKAAVAGLIGGGAATPAAKMLL